MNRSTSVVGTIVATCVLFSAGAQETPPIPPYRQKAIDILLEAGTGPDPALRSNALEALQQDPARALPITDKGLRDQNPGVRYAAAVTAGMLKLRPLTASLYSLLQDENLSVRAAALYALHILGEPVDITPLADMLASDDTALRGNVALLLGLVGNESAIPMLKRAADDDIPKASNAKLTVLRMQIAEALARLGDVEALDALRAGAYNPYHEVKLLAITAMGAVNDRKMEAALLRLMTDPDISTPRGADKQTAEVFEEMRFEMRLACAGALARMGNRKGSRLAVELASSRSPMIRVHAAWVLGWMDDAASLRTLQKLLDDPFPQVRVSAAAGLLRR